MITKRAHSKPLAAFVVYTAVDRLGEAADAKSPPPANNPSSVRFERTRLTADSAKCDPGGNSGPAMSSTPAQGFFDTS